MSEGQFPWRTLLFVSVAVNLLVIGAAVGAYGAGVRVAREAPGEIVDRIPGPRALMAALPHGTRVKMREELAASWVRSRQLREAAAQARRDSYAAMAAEPYDAARVKTAFAHQRAADAAIVQVFQDNIADAFAGLSPEERRTALEALRNAAPARRQASALGASEEGAAQPGEQLAPRALTPEGRQARRERIRARWRERHADQQ